MFTIADLHKAMKYSPRRTNCRLAAGEYELSVAYSDFNYCTPKENIPSDEYIAVELALFKGEEWVYSKSDLNIILSRFAALWAPTPERSYTSVAGWVGLQTVCDIVNHLRGPEIVTVPTVSKHTKGCCRRCGGYDDYIQDGDLCYRCCG